MTVTKKLPGVAASIREARQLVDEWSERLPPARVDDLRLLISEVMTNALTHAPLGPSDFIELTLRLNDDQVHVSIVQPGPFFDRDLSRRAGSGDEDAGIGFRLLDFLATRWGVRSDPTTVWFELSLRDDESDDVEPAT